MPRSLRRTGPPNPRPKPKPLSKPECQQCFDEEGSLVCIQLSHSTGQQDARLDADKIKTCCTEFGNPIWYAGNACTPTSDPMHAAMSNSDIYDGCWYHYTGGNYPHKNKYIRCDVANPNSGGIVKSEPEKETFVAEEIEHLGRGKVCIAGCNLPLFLQEVRWNCWRISLDFGPHSFTLLEYKTKEPAEGALRSITTNWNQYNPYAPVPAPVKLDQEQVNFHLKCLAGRILTLVDAMISNENQNKAFKKYVKQEFREQFSRVHRTFNDPGCETTDPEELAVAKAEF